MRKEATSRYSVPERLVRHVQELERLAELKQHAADAVKTAFETASGEGFDPTTLKVVLKLRKLTPGQRQERRALEAIYMAALGMLEGEALPEAARRRLDGQPNQAPSKPGDAAPPEGDADAPAAAPEDPPVDPQPVLPLKDPAEARQEGASAAEAGKRIYDNPYPAGDPCRAAWDEGWCAQRKSNGMEPPAAYARRTDPPAKDPNDDAPKKGDA